MANNFLDNALLAQLWQKILDNFQLKSGSIYYSTTTTYNEGNVVLYNANLYICKQTSLNHLPTDTTYWSIVNNKIIDLR